MALTIVLESITILSKTPNKKKAGSLGNRPFLLLSAFAALRENYLMSRGTINRATMFTTLIMGLMAGPAVSL